MNAVKNGYKLLKWTNFFFKELKIKVKMNNSYKLFDKNLQIYQIA